MEALLLKIFLLWQFWVACTCLIALLFAHRKVKKFLTNEKCSFIRGQLSKGFLGLTSSRKGVLCLLLFAGSQIPMTILCFLGKIDGTAYGVCLSSVTTAVVAVFCHTQSKTDQMLGAPGLPIPSTVIDTVIGSDGSATQTMSGPGITANATAVVPSVPVNTAPIVPVVPGVDVQPLTTDNSSK